MATMFSASIAVRHVVAPARASVSSRRHKRLSTCRALAPLRTNTELARLPVARYKSTDIFLRLRTRDAFSPPVRMLHTTAMYADQRLQPNPIIARNHHKRHRPSPATQGLGLEEAADPLLLKLTSPLASPAMTLPLRPQARNQTPYLHRPPRGQVTSPSLSRIHRLRASVSMFIPFSIAASSTPCRPRRRRPRLRHPHRAAVLRPHARSSSRPRRRALRASSSASSASASRPPALQLYRRTLAQDAEFFDQPRRATCCRGSAPTRSSSAVRHAEPQRRRQQSRHRIAALGSWPDQPAADGAAARHVPAGRHRVVVYGRVIKGSAPPYRPSWGPWPRSPRERLGACAQPGVRRRGARAAAYNEKCATSSRWEEGVGHQLRLLRHGGMGRRHHAHRHASCLRQPDTQRRHDHGSMMSYM